MDIIEENILEPATEFYKSSKRLVTKCKKPDQKEFQRIAFATAAGFLILGLIGFFVKLIHIPINSLFLFFLLLFYDRTICFRHYRRRKLIHVFKTIVHSVTKFSVNYFIFEILMFCKKK